MCRIKIDDIFFPIRFINSAFNLIKKKKNLLLGMVIRIQFMWIWYEIQLNEWSVGFIISVHLGIMLNGNVHFPIYHCPIRNGWKKISNRVYWLAIQNAFIIKAFDVKVLVIIVVKHYSFADMNPIARKVFLSFSSMD